MSSSSRSPRSESGAVATIVVVLLAFGVLLGFTAIAVDVGRTVVERRELQNGADAGALSLAQSCAQGNCVAGADGLAGLVNANAADSEHDVVEQCGSAGTGLPACSASSVTDIRQCPPVPAGFASVPYVEVRTQTSSGGGNTIQNFFGGAAGGVGDSTVDTCARAGWGPPGSASVLPLTFSYCEYEDAIAKVGYGGETALAVKYKVTGKDTTDPCPDLGHTGMDTPGGFGWLDQTDCLANIDVGGWVPIDTGKSGPAYCVKAGDTVLIPIFDCVSKLKFFCDNVAGGAKTDYHIDGFAAFYVTALVGPGKDDKLPGYPKAAAAKECKDEAVDGKSCLFGWFLDDYIDFSGTIDPGGTDYGAKVVQPLG